MTTITFIVKHKARKRVTSYVFGLIPITKTISVTETSEYIGRCNFDRFEDAEEYAKSVCEMLSKFYGPNCISVEPCEFGDYPDVIEFKPLGARA